MVVWEGAVAVGVEEEVSVELLDGREGVASR
uniref:Uncharacterized protein n=1 Tax=Arundo donax TaxID=35708 RepID=A0A0A9BHP4_ARUDO